MALDYFDNDRFAVLTQDCKEHLILFSLFNALLPDVELKTRLLSTTCFTKCLNVVQKSIVDTLKISCIHAKETLKGLAETHS